MRKVTQLNHVVSDGGAEVRAMRIRLDHMLDGIRTPRQRLKEARQKVMKENKCLLPVFDMIVRNGANRRESICRLAKRGMSYFYARRRYYAARNKLLKLFNV